MTTLDNLVNHYEANAIVMGQAGNGSSIDESGELFDYDENIKKQYGNVEMHELPEQHVSNDGKICHWASFWIVAAHGENPLRVRFYF